MKIVRFSHESNVSYGVVEENKVSQIEDNFNDFINGSFIKTGNEYALNQIKLLPPCSPTKVVCVGLNYRNHALELGLPIPEVPILFMKPSTTVIGHNDNIIYPIQSKRVDYEAELGVVIGKKARNVKSRDALEYVLGYTCANDVTARDLQPPTGQWTYAKCFDTFCPIGPWIETSISDPEELELYGYLNGNLVQKAPTSDHIFPVKKLIEYISGCMTLLPGDVIITGTPSGIKPFDHEDIFEVEIPGVGKLKNTLIK